MPIRPTGSRLVVLTAACAAVLVVAAVPAAAHGPCKCTTPAAGVPGQRVVTSYPTVRVVWNPLAGGGLVEHVELAGEHVAGQPRMVLLERARPGPAELRIPATAPRRYMVLLYGGEEARLHSSWDYVTVRPAPRPSPLPSPHATTLAVPPAPPADGPDGLALAGLIAAVVTLLGAGTVAFLRRRRAP